MAVNDYVTKASTAIARGARAIVAAILSRGGSGQEASAALSETFPSLSGQIVGGLVRGQQQSLAAGVGEFQGGAAFGAPSLRIAAGGDIPFSERIVVAVSATLTDGRTIRIPHVVDLSPGEARSQAQLRAQREVGVIFAQGESPRLNEDTEGEDVVDVESEVVDVQQRIGG